MGKRVNYIWQFLGVFALMSAANFAFHFALDSALKPGVELIHASFFIIALGALSDLANARRDGNG